ncbi:MAG: DUF2007 domain-containing protein [Candidatus Hydrogenedentes bacterium]|nr:DUF2007 domain-containing protein [Candidatus Hydrogenedentota bacterium]
MFCPGCGAEFDPGVTMCGECQVELVEEQPDMEPHFQDSVCVFETDDKGEIALAESLLQGADIPYVVQNAMGQNILGLYSRASMMAFIEVKPEHAEAAAELLADLNEGVDSDVLDEVYEDDDEDGETS